MSDDPPEVLGGGGGSAIRFRRHDIGAGKVPVMSSDRPERPRNPGASLGPAPEGGARAAWLLGLAALLLAVVTAVVFMVLVPLYNTATVIEENAETGRPELILPEPDSSSATLVEAVGWAGALVTLVPAVLLLVPLLVPERLRSAARVGAGVVLTAFVLLGIATIGAFFVPTLVLAWAAVLAPGTCEASESGRRAWRVVGALLIVASVIALEFSVGMGTVEIDPFAVVLGAASIVVAVGFGLGRTWAYVASAVGGAVLLVLAAASESMLMLAFWLAGGFWLAFGIAALAVRTARPDATLAVPS